MSSLIRKEQLTAYQRWELTSFDESPPPPVKRTAAELAADEAARQAEQENLALEQARNAARAAAMEEGRAAGFEQGRAEGFEQGRAEGLAHGRAEAQQEKAQLLEIAQAFGTEVAGASERISADVLELALDLSKAMLKGALAIRPELVIPVVADAIRHLPALQQPALLFLHPADAQLVGSHVGDELARSGWRVAEDAQLERGGCRVETATNQIDATISSRWQRIAAALGKESDWLSP